MGSGFFSIEVALNAKLKHTKKKDYKIGGRWKYMFNKDKKRDVKTKW